MENKKMKIITINVSVIFLKAFDILSSHYPSRSECMRHALREFLIKEMQFNTLLTGEDHENIIKSIQEEDLSKLRMEYQKKPLGNKFYLEGLGINEVGGLD